MVMLSVAAGCQVGDDVIMIWGGFYGGWLIQFSILSFDLFEFVHSSGPTDPVDQAAMVALWNGLTNKGNLVVWDTTSSVCDLVDCTSAGKVTLL